jgi:hypothetical protein
MLRKLSFLLKRRVTIDAAQAWNERYQPYDYRADMVSRLARMGS